MLQKKITIQDKPFIFPINDGKVIKERFGIASDGNSKISMAHIKAPSGWSAPFRTPEFDKFIFIIKGKKQFIIEDKTIISEAGQSIKIEKNTRVQYAKPIAERCEYIAICMPALSIDLVNRETK